MLLITVRDVSGILKLSEQTIYRKVKKGELPCVRLGKNGRGGLRFDKEAITNWLLSQSNILDS